MSWDKLEVEIHQESFRQRNEIISGKKGNDNMDLAKMSIEELKDLGEQINSFIEYKQEEEVREVVNEFLEVWKKMEKLGVMLRTEEIITMSNGGKKVKDLQIEINGKLINIYQ